MKKPEQSGHEPIIARMGEWREGQAGDILITRDLGPCIGIAIYEPLTKKGFLLHEPLPEDGGTYERFEDRLRQVFQDQPGSFERTRAWLSGGSGPSAARIRPGAEDLVAENRRFVEEAMSDLGIPPESVRVAWTPDVNHSAEMTLDCSTGTCEINFL